MYNKMQVKSQSKYKVNSIHPAQASKPMTPLKPFAVWFVSAILFHDDKHG